MSPQKQKLTAELFVHSAKPESASRDPDTARLIADGTGAVPHGADTLDELNADYDSYFADDDTWFE
jgi:hypothetical protein